MISLLITTPILLRHFSLYSWQRFYCHQAGLISEGYTWKQWVHTIPKKGGKNKERMSEPDSDVEIISRTENRFEYTKAITGVSP